MNWLRGLDFPMIARIGRALPLALLASILLHALVPASPLAAPELGSTFRADTANVCVLATSRTLASPLPAKKAPEPFTTGDALPCAALVAVRAPISQPAAAIDARVRVAAPSRHRAVAAPRAPPAA